MRHLPQHKKAFLSLFNLPLPCRHAKTQSTVLLEGIIGTPPVHETVGSFSCESCVENLFLLSAFFKYTNLFYSSSDRAF